MSSKTNGWHTLAKPSDQMPGIRSLHYNDAGAVTVWHEIGPAGSDARYRVTRIAADGTVTQATGRTKHGTWGALRSAT